MASIHGFTEANLNDHEFAAWLRKNGWTGGYHHVGTGTLFHGPNPGSSIAVAIYDNRACTKKVFIPT